MLPALSKPFYSVYACRELGPGPSDTSLLQGCLVQLLQLDAKGSNIGCNHSASHGKEEIVLVWGTESGLTILAMSSMIIWTKLQRFRANGRCWV